MSNLERSPAEVRRGGRAETPSGPVLDLVPGRKAPLGDGTDVRRVLPTLGRRMVGAWCFFDHYGPDDVSASPGMQVPPHPHTGLQTVSWLLEGTVHHRDSLGHDVVVAPGSLGLMTAGHGIAHSEQSPVPHPSLLHGAQLWVALPDHARDTAPAFEHHTDLPTVAVDAARIRVVLGGFGGVTSPGTVHTPLVGLDVVLDGTAVLPLEPDFEYAAVAVDAGVSVDGVDLPVGSLLYLGTGRGRLEVTGAGRLMLLGGEPFAEQIVMWWNLLGRSHDEIAGFRAQWQDADDRFGTVPGWSGERTDAPPLPGGRLRPRGAAD